MSIYKNFLTKLLAYRKENPALYAGRGESLYLTGDSHSLTYAGLPLRVGGADYKIESHLIIGTKAWHLVTPAPDARREALLRYIARLPEGAKLICAFGEIDCRVNTGILPHVKKTGENLETIVAGLVRKYVAFMTEAAERRSLRLIFLSVPAPHPASGDRARTIALFNKELEARVRESRHQYADLYTPTLNENGMSLGRIHIDNYHLKPEALKIALES